jgi:heme/copper-type cytochrome/quinol oxidase subunit 4
VTHSSRPLPQDPRAAFQQTSHPAAERPAKGTWYFLITVLTAGFLAAIPFWHAWSRLRSPAVRTLAVAYTAVDVFLVVLMALTPSPNPDGSSSNSAISTIGGFTVFAVVIVACLQLRGLRRQVYARSSVAPVIADPAVARALAGRQRRDEARQMWASDPALARELGVGRADPIVAAREARGGTYFNLGELLVDVSLPPHVQQGLTDRAVI